MGLNETEIKAQGRRLSEFYGKEPTPGFTAMFIEEMQKYGSRSITEGISHCMKNHERFPALSQIVAIVDSIQYKIDQEHIEAEKRKEREDARKFFSGQLSNDEYAKASCMAIAGLLGGKLTRSAYVKVCEGLSHNMNPLKQFYEENRMNPALGPRNERIPA